MDYLATAWRQPDEGIWEVRGGPQHFVHSKVMAWVAFDRAANELEAQRFNESGGQWRRIADEIHAEVCERGFDRNFDSFVQAYGSKRVDASLLLIPLVGFLPPDDARVRGTLPAIEQRLLIDGEFVLRYETENPAMVCPQVKELFWRAVFGWWKITYCKTAMRKPASYSSVYSRAATTPVCSPKRSIH